jgi:hypothetical protein
MSERTLRGIVAILNVRAEFSSDATIAALIDCLLYDGSVEEDGEGRFYIPAS